jgi:hypothetical protein
MRELRTLMRKILTAEPTIAPISNDNPEERRSIESEAPRAAPELTPKVKGLASGFLKIVW